MMNEINKLNSYPLVSIITPCFNGEKKIPAFLESVLHQTYKNVEFIFINDGSTDNTKNICFEYEKKFNDRGYIFRYLEQENQGQAEAINTGLPYVTGKYLTWPDSDDILHADYLEKKVEFLELNPDMNMVISPISHMKENGEVICIERRIQKKKDDFFLDLVNGENVFYTPGGYMVRTKDFFECYPDKRIRNNRMVGQNIQMLLPMAYLQKYGYLDDTLYDYIIYDDSHAHSKRSLEDAIVRSDTTCDLVCEVISDMDVSEDEKSQYYKLSEHEKYRRRFYYAIKYRNRKLLNESYSVYRKTGKVLPKVWLLHKIRNVIW